MLVKIVYITLFILLSITSVTSAATWWDVKDVHRTEDGCIEYSLYINNYLNKDNGDVFTGVVVQRYGNFYPPVYNSITKRLEQICGSSAVNKVIALKGTINGRDITNVPLYIDTVVKYVAHRDKKKCNLYYQFKGERKEVLKDYYVTKDKKGREITTSRCKCPVVSMVEKKPRMTEENRDVWEMMSNLNSAYNGVNLYYDTVKIDENITTYLEPNIFNGTYVVNGEVRVLDLHTVKNRVKKVVVRPLESVYENSAIFYIFDTKNGNDSYKVYKENNVYKVRKDDLYVNPTDEIINYAEVIAKILGINLVH